jgi:hypothetical protein
MKRRVPGQVIEVGVPNYREAMPLLRALPFVKSVEVSGELLRILVALDNDEQASEVELRSALEGAGFTVEAMHAAPTDLEMAFATLIPNVGEVAVSTDEDILAVQS